MLKASTSFQWTNRAPEHGSMSSHRVPTYGNKAAYIGTIRPCVFLPKYRGEPSTSKRLRRLTSAHSGVRSVSSSANSTVEQTAIQARDKVSVSTSQKSVLAIFTWPVALAQPSEVYVAGSFNNWEPIALRKISANSEDFVRSVVLPAGPIQFKFITDGIWRVSPRVAIAVGPDGLANNHQDISVNTVIQWKSEKRAEKVYVSGSFVNWQELLPLQKNESGHHYVNCCLPVGQHHIQFLVDGVWHMCGELPSGTDDSGRACNVLSVRKENTFQIFYMSQWRRPTLLSRLIDKDGNPLEEWTGSPLERTQSRLAPWKAGHVDTSRIGDRCDEACGLEFMVEATSGKLDALPGGLPYCVMRPGAYKLEGGRVRPFPQACHAPILLVSDIDGTMIDESTEADVAAAEFQAYWESTATLCNSTLVYNTGRSIGQFTGLYEYKQHCMTMPNVVITAVGTKIFMLNRRATRRTAEGADVWEEDLSYSALLDKDWDLRAVRAAAEPCISDRCVWLDNGSEHPHRIALSVHRDMIDDVIARLRRSIEGAGVRAQFVVSGDGEWRYLDVLSLYGGKMAAVEYVRRVYGIPKSRVVTAGDSGNDILMLEGDNPAIVVGNAQPTLLDWLLTQDQSSQRVVLADNSLARGILEGLARHGLY